MHTFKLLFLSFIISLSSVAVLAEDTTPKTPPPQEETEKAPLKEIEDLAKESWASLSQSRQRREETKYFAYLNYAPLDLIIPSKIGVTLGLNLGADKSWELEYLRGSFSVPVFIADIGSITEQRISLTKRSFFGSNSLNIHYGVSFFSLNVHLGDEFIKSMSGNYPSAEVVGLEAWGFNLGIGNRWTIKKNITFGVDWVSWSQPVYLSKKDDDYLNYSTSEDYKDDVDTALKIASYLPRITVLKLQFGMMF